MTVVPRACTPCSLSVSSTSSRVGATVDSAEKALDPIIVIRSDGNTAEITNKQNNNYIRSFSGSIFGNGIMLLPPPSTAMIKGWLASCDETSAVGSIT